MAGYRRRSNDLHAHRPHARAAGRQIGAAVIVIAAAAIGLLPRTVAVAASPKGPVAATGLLLQVSPRTRTVVVSLDAITGVRPAGVLTVRVAKNASMTGLEPGAMVDLGLVLGRRRASADTIHVHRAQPMQQDPMTAQRLSLMRRVVNGGKPGLLRRGALVPDFTLIDQQSHPVTLSAFRGRIVAINFMYTSCTLPDFCLRIVNHFGVLQKTFAHDLGRDLEFLTISFDPMRDRPPVLAEYARQWSPDPAVWHFLTGDANAVQRVVDEFGVSAVPDEGLMDHTLHTAVLDRQGRLIANIEGNEYSSDQLADLIRLALKN